MTLKRKGQRGRMQEVRGRDAAYFYPVCLSDDWLIGQRKHGETKADVQCGRGASCHYNLQMTRYGWILNFISSIEFN